MPHYAPDSPMGRELLKWEQFPGPYGQVPGNPYVYREFPKMVYKAERGSDGRVTTHRPGNYRLAQDANDEAKLLAEGFVATQEEAMDRYNRDQREKAKLEAEIHYETRRMSEPAQREVRAAIEADAEHVPMIPETPVRKKPGRKPKAAASAVEA